MPAALLDEAEESAGLSPDQTDQTSAVPGEGPDTKEEPVTATPTVDTAVKPSPDLFPVDVHPIPTEEFSRVHVTPAIARGWLARNTHNRKVKLAAVVQYTEAMKSGVWLLNGDTIRFDRDGVLLDGQNKLQAVVNSGRAQTFYVVTGLDRESQQTMDQGVPRTAADDLRLRGIKNWTVTASGVVLALRAEKGDLASQRLRLRTPEVIGWLDSHPEYQQHADHAATYWKRYDMRPAVLAYTSWVLHGVDPETAEEFFRRWREADTGGTATALGAVVEKFKVAKSSGQKGRLDAYTQIMFLMRAWNAWIRGERIERFQTTKDGKRLPIPDPIARPRADA
jgi:hypothetical protein